MEILAFPQASGGAPGGEKPDPEGDLWQKGWKEAGELDKASSSSGRGRPTRGMEGAKLDVRVLTGPAPFPASHLGNAGNAKTGPSPPACWED